MNRLFMIGIATVIYSTLPIKGQELMPTHFSHSNIQKEEIAVKALNILGLDERKQKTLNDLKKDVVRIADKTLFLYHDWQRYYGICHLPECQSTFEKIGFDNLLYAFRNHLINVHGYKLSDALRVVPYLK